jgi:cytoskeletal protein RodZ
LIIPALVAIFAIVAFVGAWKTLQGREGSGVEPNPPPAATAPTAPTAPAGTTPSPAQPPSRSPTPADSATPETSRSPTPDRTRPRWKRSAPVVVLNATSRTGLAAAEAARLRAKGWTVRSIGNWRSGGVARTTVFSSRFPLATRTLRHDADVPGRARRPLPGMPADTLVLVLAS